MPGDCVIVGGCGFLGTALTRRLAAPGKGGGARVVVIDRQAPAAPCAGVDYHTADIRDAAALLRLARACPPGAWVVNLAARQYQAAIPRRGRAQWFAGVNVDGALHVGRLAAEIRAAGWVQFSTDMVYGLPRAVPVGEDHPHNPVGEYGASKAQMERRVRAFANAHRIPLTLFRPRLISGPGRLGVFTRLFALIHRHRPLPLIGNGRNFYQMVAVEDCARAVLCAIERGCPNTVYNLGSTPTLCVRDLLTALRDRVQSRSPLVPLPAAPVRAALRTLALFGVEPLYPEQYQLADRHFIVTTQKAQSELNWQPSRDDLEMLVDAYRYWERL